MTTAEKAKGSWKKIQDSEYRHGYEVDGPVYRFTAASGFTADMGTYVSRPKRSYHCKFRDPDGNPAEYLSPQGRRVTGMELDLPLAGAKAAVQERVRELELQREEG